MGTCLILYARVLARAGEKWKAIVFATMAQITVGVAKDLTKLGGRSCARLHACTCVLAVLLLALEPVLTLAPPTPAGGKTVTKLVTPDEQQSRLFKLVSLITGWKNSLKGGWRPQQAARCATATCFASCFCVAYPARLGPQRQCGNAAPMQQCPRNTRPLLCPLSCRQPPPTPPPPRAHTHVHVWNCRRGLLPGQRDRGVQLPLCAGPADLPRPARLPVGHYRRAAAGCARNRLSGCPAGDVCLWAPRTRAHPPLRLRAHAGLSNELGRARKENLNMRTIFVQNYNINILSLSRCGAPHIPCAGVHSARAAAAQYPWPTYHPCARLPAHAQVLPVWLARPVV